MTRLADLCCIFVVVATLLSIACDGSFSRAREMQRRTEQAGAMAGAISEPERTPNGVSFSWDVRSRAAWLEYRGDVINEFKGDFHVMHSDDRSLVLSRSDGGDAYRLEFRAATVDEGIQVHVVFAAFAN